MELGEARVRVVRSLLVAGSVAAGVLAGAAGPSAAGHGHDLDCGDFAYYEDALAHLRAHPSDPDRLDSDGDGSPCETLASRPASPPPPTPAPPPAAPVGEVFRDVLPGQAHTPAIEAMAAAGVISGYGDGTFRPAAQVTRGQMAALLYRAGDFPPGSARFPDTTGTTHEQAVAALADAGVISGYGDGTFRPAAPISRAQMATMLARAFALPAGGVSPFTDTAGSPHAPGIAALAAAGITTGYADGTFRPTLTVTRGQTASFLDRALRLGTPGPTQPSPTQPSPAQPDPAQAGTVTHVVDGDTLDVTTPAGGTVRVRLVGIDTPERGQCGFTEATEALADLTLGRAVSLIPGAQDDTDRYGRLLRYVDAAGTDPALTLLQRGLAIARYDSHDGYGPHPRETAYVNADASVPQLCPA